MTATFYVGDADLPEKAWLSVVIPADLKQWLRERAAQDGVSMSAFVVRLLQREAERAC